MNSSYLPSDLFRSSSKSAAHSTVSLIALSFAMLGAPTVAYAACTGVNTATVSCTGSDPSTIDTSFAGNSNATITNWSVNGRFIMHNPGSGSADSLFASGVTGISNVALDYGVLHVTAAGLGSNPSMTVENSNLTQNQFGHGIAVHANNATGSGVLNATNVNITMAAAAGVDSGATLAVNGSGNGTLSFMGGSITSANTGPAMFAHSGTGNISVTVGGGFISSTGNGSHGINATTGGAGTLTVTNGDAITTTGSGANGISTSASGGATIVTNSGVLSTSGTNGFGINAASTSGAIRVDNTAAITVSGAGTSAAATGPSAVQATSTSGNVTITGSGTINSTNAGNFRGFGAFAQTATGTATVNYSGNVTTKGEDASALRGAATGIGNVVVGYTGNQLEVFGDNADAINAFSSGGSVNVNAQGTLITHGNAGAGANAYGITASTNGAGNVGVAFTGAKIEVEGTGSGAIATNAVGGITTIQNSGALITHGTSGIAIVAASTTGAQNITNSGSITALGQRGRGISSLSTAGGSIVINNTGGIVTNGNETSSGIVARALGGGNVTVSSIGANITTNGNNSNNGFGGENDGIDARANSGAASVTFSNGTVSVAGHSAGIAAWNNNSGLASTAAVTITGGTIDATRAYSESAVQAFALTSGSINIDAASVVHGGWSNPAVPGLSAAFPSTGIALGGATQTLSNAGIVDALSDAAIIGDVGTAGSLSITNTGQITGSMSALTSRTTVNNSGLWNLRNFSDTNGDKVRDRLAVSVSDFGTSGANTINNSGTIALLGRGGAAAQTLDTTGMYLPLGFTFNTMALNSPVQGQILGVQTFNNSGVIDMTANPEPGDVLVISGGHTAGVDGGGVFVANGGTVRFNTVLNEGGTNSQSDILVLDSTRLGSAATGLKVNNFNGSGALTPGNGIALVEVLNKAASAAGVFVLNGDYTTKDGQQAVVGGAYAYTLFHNGVGSDSADGNWYLRSTIIPTPPGPTPPRYQAGVPLYEVYPQHLLALNTVPTLQQRVGNRYWKEPAPETVFCKDASQNFQCPVTNEQSQYYAGSDGHQALIEDQRAIWGRIEGSHASIEPAVTTSSTDYDTNVWKLQAGLDGLLHETEAGSKLIGGITVHFGQASSDVTSFFGDGDINTNGYGFGGTLTWYDQNGFYVDGQAQLTWFNSDLTSKALGLETPTLVDGNGGFGYALSLETGKKIDLNDTWTLTPQAQLVYANVDFSSFRDVFGANVSLGSGDSLLGRLGISADHDQNWKDDEGKTRRRHLYGIANLYYQFLDATKVDVSGVSFESRPDRLWGGLGLGGSYNWNDDKYSVYGEVSVNSSLENFGDSYALAGTAGFRIKW